jgi:hypothetical protein
VEAICRDGNCHHHSGVVAELVCNVIMCRIVRSRTKLAWNMKSGSSKTSENMAKTRRPKMVSRKSPLVASPKCPIVSEGALGIRDHQWSTSLAYQLFPASSPM